MSFSVNRLKWALLITVSGLVVLAAAELALRVADFSYYWALYKRPDPVLGWAPPPGTEAWQRFEGRARVRINSAGFRDREHATGKPPGTLRIAILGDSFAEAVQVPLEHTFWSVLERQLGDCRALEEWSIEVLNFGVSGYSTAQELLTLRHRVWSFQPDVVLLAFFVANDLVENSPVLDEDPLRPYFVYEGDRLVLDDSYRRSARYRRHDSWYGGMGAGLLGHSRLLQALHRALDIVQVRWQGRSQAAASEAPNFPVDPRLDVRAFRAPADPDWRAAWRVTEGLLKEMDRATRDHGARLVVVTLSTGIQVHPDPELRARFADFLGVEHLFYPDWRIRALGDAEGFAVINLAADMQLAATFYGLWLHGFDNTRPGIGHWNETGHAMAGEQIADRLCHGELPAWLQKR
jgi:hypothetical protein